MTYGHPNGWRVEVDNGTASLHCRKVHIYTATGTTDARAVHALERWWKSQWIHVDRGPWHRAHARIVDARTDLTA